MLIEWGEEIVSLIVDVSVCVDECKGRVFLRKLVR